MKKMKKLLALILSVMVLTLAFTACAKKDSDTKEPTQTETTENGKAEDSNSETVKPDQSTEVENTEMSEFEKLIDTFNNSEDEEAKEAARIELEKILEQAEQNAQ